jgi:hypothetical protein
LALYLLFPLYFALDLCEKISFLHRCHKSVLLDLFSVIFCPYSCTQLKSQQLFFLRFELFFCDNALVAQSR